MTVPVAPAETNIEVIQGGTFSMRVAWTDQQDPPEPISLASYFAHMQIRSRRKATATRLADMSSFGITPALIIEPDGLTGVVDVRMPATMSALLGKSCFYDLFVINKTDPTDATRLVYGSITVSPSVTVTITFPAGSLTVTANQDGSFTLTADDGTIITQNVDGSYTLVVGEGNVVTANQDGSFTIS